MKTTAAETPQQNNICERRGGIWKGVAKSVIDQHSVSFTDDTCTKWTIAVCNWSLNSRIGDTSYNPSQWVLGRGMRLPYDLLSHGNKISLHLRARDDASFLDRIDLLSAERRATAMSRYNRGSPARSSRAPGCARPSLQSTNSPWDRMFYFHGASKRNWAGRWHGPASSSATRARTSGFPTGAATSTSPSGTFASQSRRSICCGARCCSKRSKPATGTSTAVTTTTNNHTERKGTTTDVTTPDMCPPRDAGVRKAHEAPHFDMTPDLHRGEPPRTRRRVDPEVSPSACHRDHRPRSQDRRPMPHARRTRPRTRSRRPQETGRLRRPNNPGGTTPSGPAPYQTEEPLRRR